LSSIKSNENTFFSPPPPTIVLPGASPRPRKPQRLDRQPAVQWRRENPITAKTSKKSKISKKIKKTVDKPENDR